MYYPNPDHQQTNIKL